MKNHFPLFRFLDGKKWLYNPILKKRFSNRPEERVRLRYVEFLLLESAFSKNRIGFEAPVRPTGATHSLRADLVLYSDRMEPHILIECKSEHVKLTEQTAEQIARYNRELDASYLMITNGRQELWYELTDGTPRATANPIPKVKKMADPSTDPSYWTNRGFISSSSDIVIGKLASNMLHKIFSTADPASLQYLNLPSDIVPFLPGHYYRVLPAKNNFSVALTVLNGGTGATLFTAAVNRENENLGLLWIELDQIQGRGIPQVSLISKNGHETKTLPPHFRTALVNHNRDFIKHITDQILNFF